jgi:hypothetical protein
MVFLIDRLFIQADWVWQAAKQRRELTRAAWEAAPPHERLATPSELNWSARTGRYVARIAIISFRVLLSAAIGLTIASFLELVIYKHELKSIIHRLHYEDNKAIYDEISARTGRLDQEIATARSERDRLLNLKNQLEQELNNLELAPPPPLPSEQNMSVLDSQIADLQNKIAEEQVNSRRYSQDMVGEYRGTVVNQGNSGMAGPGQRYWTAHDLKSLSEQAIAGYRKEISALEEEKKRAFSNRDSELAVAKTQSDERKGSIRGHLKNVTEALSAAQGNLSNLENGRDTAIGEFVLTLKSKPNFVPLSFGVASQFRALRTLYRDYGSGFEMIMIKLLIMMLEMTPVLQKVFLSPTTLYAVKLEAAKRTESYAHFDEEVRLRQQHLKRKFDATFDETYDGDSLERWARQNGVHEGRGVG